jgi:DNA-binding NarL/FixJ family response regulator
MSDAISILFIDGNKRDRDYYAWRLQASPLRYDIVHAATGRAGLDRCARQPIDCVVVEIDLPDMSGFEVLAKLVRSACHPEMAVVVLTGQPNPYLLELALKNGAQGALQKMTPSGHMIERSILNAIASVKRDRELRHGQTLSDAATTPLSGQDKSANLATSSTDFKSLHN